MKISVAQTRPIIGDIESNIINHIKLIDVAVTHQADIIIFPELSLTGYEPALAQSLAIDSSDSRLDAFQKISDAKGIFIGVGAPTRTEEGICISLVIFQPHQQRHIYSKKYLHPDELPYFVRGNSIPILEVGPIKLALAICYELSIQEHTDYVFKNGADIYVASVAKFERSMDATESRLSEIAKEHATLVLMANSVGEADGDVCAGKSAIWDRSGLRIAQLENHVEGIITIDLDSQTIIRHSN